MSKDLQIDFILDYIPKSFRDDETSKNFFFLKQYGPTTSTLKKLFKDIQDEVDEKIGSNDYNILLVKVPSHDPNNPKNPLLDPLMSNLVSLRERRFLKIDLLQRTKLIEKKATGGSREIEIDLESITCQDYKDQDITLCYLLDDITTSGNSFKACSQKIKEIHPKWEIRCIAIGKTIHE